MKRKKGVFLGLLAGALWGLDGVLMGVYLDKTAFSSTNALIVAVLAACIHDGLAGLWIFLKNLISGKANRYVDILRNRSLRPLIFGAILGGPIGMTGNLLSIQLAGTSYSSAITACYPVLGALLGVIFLKEKVNLSGSLGIILAVLGAIVVGYKPPEAGNYLYFYLGIGCSVLAVIGWALEGVISTYCMSSIDPDIAIGIREISSFAAYSIIIYFLGAEVSSLFINVLSNEYFLIIGLASVAGAFSYLCWYRSMNILGVSIGMSLNTTYALWSIIFCFIIAELKLTPTLVMGALIVTLGTVLTIRGTKKDGKGTFPLPHQ